MAYNQISENSQNSPAKSNSPTKQMESMSDGEGEEQPQEEESIMDDDAHSQLTFSTQSASAPPSRRPSTASATSRPQSKTPNNHTQRDSGASSASTSCENCNAENADEKLNQLLQDALFKHQSTNDRIDYFTRHRTGLAYYVNHGFEKINKFFADAEQEPS